MRKTTQCYYASSVDSHMNFSICYIKLIITGTEGGIAANALLQADAVLRESAFNMDLAKHQHSREVILTELAIASGRADVRIMVGSGATDNLLAKSR